MSDDLQQRLIDTVVTWDGVTASPHRFGGVEFNLGGVEVGHIHRSNGMVDIPYTRSVRSQLVQEGRTGPHHLLPDTGWTTTFIRTQDDFDRIVWLFRLSYLLKVRRFQLDISYPRELASLQLSDAMQAVVTRPASTTPTE